jgi:hypothetical protein
MHRCSWCDEQATVVLVGNDDRRRADHYACPAHEDQWGRLYRRAVRLRDDEVMVDLRAPSEIRPAG